MRNTHAIKRFALAFAFVAFIAPLGSVTASASVDLGFDTGGAQPPCGGAQALSPADPSTATLDGDNGGGGTSPSGVTVQPAPQAVQVLPGYGDYGADWPIVSDTTTTYTEGDKTHTVRTIVRRGIRSGMVVGSTNSGGKLAAPLSGVCSYTGTTIITRQDTVCGGGCMDSYMKRTADTYTQGGSNNYYGRREVRLWWTREYSAGIDFNGPAYTQWNEQIAIDCNGANQGRQVGANTSPVWYTWNRTYDYYWDESYLPIVTPGSGLGASLFVYTNTPTTYGTTLHTEISLQ